MRITNRTRGAVLAARAAVARRFDTRLVGLMGRRHLPAGEGLLFPGASWVHTLFMRFPIDLVFYGAGGEVLSVVRAVRPWRVPLPCLGARGVAELPAGTAEATGTRAGDVLEFDPPP